MIANSVAVVALWMILGSMAGAQPAFPKANHYEPTDSERAEIRAKVEKLAAQFECIPYFQMKDAAWDNAIKTAWRLRDRG